MIAKIRETEKKIEKLEDRERSFGRNAASGAERRRNKQRTTASVLGKHCFSGPTYGGALTTTFQTSYTKSALQISQEQPRRQSSAYGKSLHGTSNQYY